MTTDQAPSAGTGSAPSQRRRGSRWLLGAGAAVVAAVVVIFFVAQGGGSGGGPLNAIAKAAEVTQREPGGQMELTATVTSPTSPEGITEIGSMIFDNSGRTEGTLQVKGHETGKEVTLQTVTDGVRSYMSSPELDSVTGGKKWMELDLSSAVSGANSTVPTQAGPQEGLKILEKVLDAKEVGSEDIEGVPTRHFTGTLPTAEEVFGVKPDISKSQIDVWIDSQERVRRMEMTITGGLSNGPVSTTDITMNFSDFGREPAIEIPPQNEVFDATSLIESQIQSAAEEH